MMSFPHFLLPVVVLSALLLSSLQLAYGVETYGLPRLLLREERMKLNELNGFPSNQSVFYEYTLPTKWTYKGFVVEQLVLKHEKDTLICKQNPKSCFYQSPLPPYGFPNADEASAKVLEGFHPTLNWKTYTGHARNTIDLQQAKAIWQKMIDEHLIIPFAVAQRKKVSMLVSALVKGSQDLDLTIRSAAANGEVLSNAETVAIALQAVIPLKALHKHGVTHRDINSRNFVVIPKSVEEESRQGWKVLTGGAQLALIDLGSAYVEGTESRLFGRDPECSAPETFDENPAYNPKMDLFSLAQMLYSLGSSSSVLKWATEYVINVSKNAPNADTMRLALLSGFSGIGSLQQEVSFLKTPEADESEEESLARAQLTAFCQVGSILFQSARPHLEDAANLLKLSYKGLTTEMERHLSTKKLRFLGKRLIALPKKLQGLTFLGDVKYCRDLGAGVFWVELVACLLKFMWPDQSFPVLRYCSIGVIESRLHADVVYGTALSVSTHSALMSELFLHFTVRAVYGVKLPVAVQVEKDVADKLNDKLKKALEGYEHHEDYELLINSVVVKA
eukprot:GHVS01037348.1.p1 GENE.GHVS01037348.1~~GHVS01037348.1.p1  ORF type:complete len:561 (-),score=61.93 GHVS01037348.1:137-1819(-)